MWVEAVRSYMSTQEEVPMGMNHMTVVPENFEMRAEDDEDE
jgi:hypothetical protein